MLRINTVKIVLIVILCIIFSLNIILIKNLYFKKKKEKITQNIISNLEEKFDKKEENSNNSIIFRDGTIGIIKIPAINVNAPICEGTEKEILKYTVRSF